ncbi:MAG: response regulator [Ardenticatenaceae bacterium]|nr:response regulator [Ardenticatenaceae bacterium]
MPTVLVVEDQPAWRELLGELLSDIGFQMRAAGSYDAALAALTEGPYDLALIDVGLAGDDHENRDGLRILEQFRARFPRGHAVLLTGYGTVELAVQALTVLGADDFIRKEHFDRRRFIETVTRTIGRSEAIRAALPARESDPAATTSGRSTPEVSGRILVVEDNASWRAIYEELAEELGVELQTAVSYGEARGWLQRESYDLAVVDLKLISSTRPWENRDGFYLLRLTQEHGVPTIVVSALATPDEIDRGYEEFGIFAFFDKEGFQRNAFLKTVRDALTQAGQPPPAILPMPQRASPPPDSPLTELTERQVEVLALIARGKTNKEIADELVITTNTVKKHILAIFGKLNVNSRAAAAAEAAKWGIGSR